MKKLLQRLRQPAQVAWRAGHSMSDNFGFEMAGYLTFLALLSLFPYLILIFSVAGLFGQGETGRHLIGVVMSHLPSEAVVTLRPRIEEIVSGPPQGLLTFALLGAFWTSASAVDAVRSALNRAYHVTAMRPYFIRRLLSMLQTFLFVLVVILIMIAIVFTPLLLAFINASTGIDLPFALETFLSDYFVLVGACVLIAGVAGFYYLLPNFPLRWADVLPGAFLVVGLWVGGASLIAYYITEISKVTVVYGSLSGFIATMLFFYYMIVIFIYGAEFNHALMQARGRFCACYASTGSCFVHNISRNAAAIAIP